MSRKSFEERHRDNISRLKLVLIVVCLIAIPVTFWVNHSDVGRVNGRVSKVESPCLKYGPHSRLCRESFEKAVLTITHPEACAILRKAGLTIQSCAGARLAQETKRGNERAATKRSTGGGDATSSPPGHSQPGPPSSGPSETPGNAPPPVSGELPETASPKAEPPGLLDPTLETVCSVNALGIRICTP